MPVSCPQCGQSVNPQMRYCGYCGADLAFAAVDAEQRVKQAERFQTGQLNLGALAEQNIPRGVPLTPEILVPRLGDYLVEKGMLHKVDLERALDYQRQQTSTGVPMLLGQALLELNLVSPETLEQAVTVQILKLQTALRETNQQLELRVQERTLELQQAVDRLTELSQLKANFVANISHELRTPLTHIKGYLDILADKGLGPLSPEQLEVVAVLQRSESRLEKLIEDLIQFSLAARGELSLNLTPIDIAALIQMAANQLHYKARDGGVTVSQRLSNTLVPARGDEEKILWVIAQLLENAIKFTPKGGRVEISATFHHGRVLVAVSDTGIGIPTSRLAEIFEPFHQLDSSSTRRYAGTGLGLALSSRILEAHGSKVSVRSVEGKGSRFEFSLPAAEC